MKYAAKLIGIISVSLIGCLLSCEKPFVLTVRNYPVVQTDPVTSIDKSGVQFNGQVLQRGTDPIVDYGFIWSTAHIAPVDFTTPDALSVSLGTDMKTIFFIKSNHGLRGGNDYFVRAYAVTTQDTIYGGNMKFRSESQSPTLITAISPDHGIDGDVITIHGENFNLIQDANLVTIGGVAAQVLSSSSLMVTAVIPAIPQEGTAIVVLNAFYAQASSDQLTIINPVIDSFSPTHGALSVSIYGVFSPNINNNKIFFGNVPAYVDNCTRSRIKAYVPFDATGSVKITINVNGKTFTTTDEFLVE